MDENTQQAEQVPEQVNQDAPMPSAEQITTVEQSSQDGLPESASDRTKSEFEKLKTQLREERERREVLEGAFKTLQPKEEPYQAPIYDPDTGYVNEQVLTETQRRAIQAEERATKAEEAIKQFRMEQETKEAYQAYPEADPSSNEFDPKLKNLAAGVILQSMLNPQDFGGKQFSLKEAYDYLKADTQSAAVEQARKEGAQEAIEQLTPKEQAALEATGTSGRRSDVGQNHETLVQRTRKGDFDAIAERMNRIVSKG
jgi:hypothetical protein